METAAFEIRAETTVNEAIRVRPATVRVFNDHGIDACCGGAMPIEVAAARDGLDLQLLLRELNRAGADTR
jgi:regulator of cell morphogenesis and NO signaling